MDPLPSHAPASRPLVTLCPRRVLIALLGATALLVAASLAGQVLKYRFGHDHVYGLVNVFDVDREMNVPTWYSASTLLVAGALLALIARTWSEHPGRAARYWWGLSALFLYSSVDEASSIHELLIPVLRQTTFLPGPLYYGWVIAGFGLVAVVGALYARFVWRLAPPVRRLFLLAAAAYLGGALGVEMGGAAHAFTQGTENLGYSLWTTLEEALEMVGVAIFIYALLRQVEGGGPVRLRVTAGDAPGAAA